MKRIAKASTPGRCAWARCDEPGALIYEGGGYRILACCLGHAVTALGEVDKVPEEVRKKTFPKGDVKD